MNYTSRFWFNHTHTKSLNGIPLCWLLAGVQWSACKIRDNIQRLIWFWNTKYSGNEYTTQTICSTLFLRSHRTKFDRNKKHTPPNSNKEENIWTIQRTAAVQFRNSCDIQWVPNVCVDKYGLLALSQMTLQTNEIFILWHIGHYFDSFRIRNGSWASFSISMQEYQYNSMMKYSTLVLIQFPIDHNSWAATTDAIIQAINIRDRIRYASGLFFHHISLSPVRALCAKIT